MLNLVNGTKSIFEILIDKLKKAKIEYGVSIHWYIMTSLENNDDTIRFFEDNMYFDYGKENITFFKQGVLPMLDEAGKIILESKDKVKFAADGNGGVFKALGAHVLTNMKNKGIEWVYISGVDNILVNFVDEVFLGGTIESKLDIASKSVLKQNPNEKVGLICNKNNKPCVIEYTEIPDNMLNSKKTNGELMLSEANIVSNLFSIHLLEKLVNVPLPYHVAKKKCNMLDKQGEKKMASEPNAYKFETFIFDSYNYVDDVFVMRVKRENEFAPIKNKEGEDSPETACKLYNELYKSDSVS